MSTQVVDESVEQGFDKPPKMVHLTFVTKPDIALCGRRLKGNLLHQSHLVDCVVCVELAKKWDYYV